MQAAFALVWPLDAGAESFRSAFAETLATPSAKRQLAVARPFFHVLSKDRLDLLEPVDMSPPPK